MTAATCLLKNKSLTEKYMKKVKHHFYIVIAFLLNIVALCQKNISPQNNIFILSDDLGYGDIGCSGQQ